jgi:ubiquinone/menaquinone biosynthesis C-methylase UbiE
VTFAVSAESYARFMGRFSEPLAERFAAEARLQAGQRALDVGCGPGALTAQLVERLGPHAVVAVDPSTPFVAAARARFPDVDVRAATAEQLPFPDDSFDAAINLFSSLGYLGDEEDTRVLAEIRRVLRPGARLVVELLHRDRLVRGFAEQDWRLLGEGRLLLEQRTFDAAAGVAQTTQTLIDGAGGRESRTFSVRVYSATELVAMLGRAGFTDARAYGDLDGSPFGVDTRLVAVAVSP